MKAKCSVRARAQRSTRSEIDGAHDAAEHGGGQWRFAQALRRRRPPASDGQALAALGAARVDDSAAAARLHADEEAACGRGGLWRLGRYASRWSSECSFGGDVPTAAACSQGLGRVVLGSFEEDAGEPRTSRERFGEPAITARKCFAVNDLRRKTPGCTPAGAPSSSVDNRWRGAPAGRISALSRRLFHNMPADLVATRLRETRGRAARAAVQYLDPSLPRPTSRMTPRAARS